MAKLLLIFFIRIFRKSCIHTPYKSHSNYINYFQRICRTLTWDILLLITIGHQHSKLFSGNLTRILLDEDDSLYTKQKHVPDLICQAQHLKILYCRYSWTLYCVWNLAIWQRNLFSHPNKYSTGGICTSHPKKWKKNWLMFVKAGIESWYWIVTLKTSTQLTELPWCYHKKKAISFIMW
jgi:hypothetical protein